jgi:hypothetical protein
MQVKPMISGPLIPLELKKQVLKDWRYFIRHGFQLDSYTPDLHAHLVNYGRFYYQGTLLARENFWRHYFGASLDRLRFFLEKFTLTQVAGDHDFGIALYHHTADLNHNIYLELEDIRRTLLDLIEAIMVDIDQCNITFLAHVAHANEPGRPFAQIERDVAASYSRTLSQVEVTLSDDLRAVLAQPFQAPAIAISQPMLWAHRVPTNRHGVDQNGPGRIPFSGWNAPAARGRLDSQPATHNLQAGLTHVDRASDSSTIA